MKIRLRVNVIIKICIAMFFLICVIVPVVSMLNRITPAGFKQVVQAAQFLPAVRNSIFTALVATIISLSLALIASMCLERTTIKVKVLFSTLFVVPMLIPSISHALGLIALFGTNGLLTNVLQLSGNIYGFWGIVVGSVMYSFPVAFLMFMGILQYQDGVTLKAAEVLGVPPMHYFLDITLPYLKKTIISAFFAVFTMIVTDYGVPLMIGGKIMTLSKLMYNKAVSMIDYDAGSVLGGVLLIPAIIAFVVDILNPDNGQSSYVAERIFPNKNIGRDILAYLFCGIVSVCILAPIVAFAMMTFQTKYPIDPTFTWYHIQKTMNSGAGTYLLNSVVYAFMAAVFGTFLAFWCAYLTTRMKAGLGRLLHFVSIMSMSIPGIVLGLSYVLFFNGSAIYGTLFIVALVNTIHFFASPYLMMYNTLSKVNPNLESVGQCMGVKRFYIIKDVIVPKVKYTLYEMFVYFFVNSMMTISAVAFLAPPAPKSVALMINQFEAQRLMESAAFISLLILAINLSLKILMAVIKKRR